MRHLFLIAFFTFILSYCHSQDDISDPEMRDDIFSINLTYGSFLYWNNNQYPLNSFKRKSLGNPLQTAGISWDVTYRFDGTKEFGIRFTYNQVVPQQILIRDSLSGKIGGGYFSCNFAGVEITPNSSFSSILIGWGFSAGRIKLKGQEYRNQKNPFFAPLISLDPKFYFGHLSITFCFAYQLDISKTKWKNIWISRQGQSPDLEPLRHTGLNLHWGVGWNF